MFIWKEMPRVAAAGDLFCSGPVGMSGFALGAGELPGRWNCLRDGWLQDAAKVGAGGAALSRVDYQPTKGEAWYRAVVPGTVLTSLVANGVYPEPLYRENNRPERVPGVFVSHKLLVSDGV